jgi:hypothetical protein
MKCFICEKTHHEIMLMKLPLETIYERNHMQILGNVRPGEYMCLSCIGFQWDLLEQDQVS